jgi:hypothetical protein
MGNYSPTVPVAVYYDTGNPAGASFRYNVYLVGDSPLRLGDTFFYRVAGHDYTGSDRSGQLLASNVTDPEGDAAKAVITEGLSRDNPRLGRYSEEVDSPASNIVSRRFGLMRLVNGKTGKSKVIDVRRSAKRVTGRAGPAA